MKVLNISAGQDLANIGYRYHIAARKRGMDYRTALRTHTYLAYPFDIYWDRNDREIRDLYRDADVLHLNNSFQPYTYLGGPKDMKPAIIEQHGTQFRGYPSPMIREAVARHILQGVSTVDLMQPAPDLLHWLPSPYDLPALARIRQTEKRPYDGRILVCTAPTARGIKSTDQLITAVRELQEEGVPVDLDVIEQTTWDKCLRRKARADIFFDQVIVGYGCNAIEAWGMGIPVIAGATAWTLAKMREEFNGILPFYTATVGTIKEAVGSMCQSSDLRAAWGGIGASHAKRYHAERPALDRVLDLYEKAVKEMEHVKHLARIRVEGGDETRRGPGVFHSDTYRALCVLWGEARMKFAGGLLVLDDPYTANIMREFMVMRPEYGIYEEDAILPVSSEGATK